MARMLALVCCAGIVLGTAGCGGSASTGGQGSGGGGGGGTTADAPVLAGIAPSSAVAGSAALSLVAYGSNFADGASIEWNGAQLTTSCVNLNGISTACSGAAALSATIPASDLSTANTAKITLSNPGETGSSGGTSGAMTFTIAKSAPTGTRVRAVSGISDANDIVWDAATGKLYASVASTDPAHANTIATIDPVAGSASSFVAAQSNPNQLSISSDGSYLWAGLDGSYKIQRYLLPGMGQDISFSLPNDTYGHAQSALALQAAPVDPHSVAVVALGSAEGGDGVYVYDDATARANFVPGWGVVGGPLIDWIQWGADDTKIYGTQDTTSDAGGIVTLDVDSTGVKLGSYGDSLALQPSVTEYDRSNDLLYSYGAAYDPAQLSMMGSFNLSETGAEACTADSGAGRYYCVTAYSTGGTDVTRYELWVFDLKSYALLNRIYFGTTADTSPSSISGAPQRLVRWGNAGLALLTETRPSDGNGGIFLIDGAAVNPDAGADASSGTASGSYAWLSSMTPDSASSGSGDVQVTIEGSGFSADSEACWNCNFGQLQNLPTTYVSATQLKATIPLSSVPATVPLEISVYDPGLKLFSSNALTFTVVSASQATQVTPMNLCGLSMRWDSSDQLLYVGTADYDGEYPNSIVAVDPTTGTVKQAQTVEPDPVFVSESAQDKYLYAAYNGATNITQLSLPDLNVTATTPLRPVQGQTWLPGDMKAAPDDPGMVAVTMIMPGYDPESLGGIAVFENGTALPDSLPGWTGGQTVPAMYDTLAWSGSDQLLTAAPSQWDEGNSGPLYMLPVDASGVSYQGQGSSTLETEGGYLHSDFGTGLIYSDGGEVADPSTGAIVGNYQASGLVAPDSTLNRVFILGQTAAQANSNNYTIESFDEKAFTPVSSIALKYLSGTPIAMVRWGNSGLAVLTSGGISSDLEDGLGMLYLVQNAQFVSSERATGNRDARPMAGVSRRWKSMSIREILAQEHQKLGNRTW